MAQIYEIYFIYLKQNLNKANVVEIDIWSKSTYIQIRPLHSEEGGLFMTWELDPENTPDPEISGARDSEYEKYCDSVWMSNPSYYLNVLSGTAEYQKYLKERGEWWLGDGL